MDEDNQIRHASRKVYLTRFTVSASAIYFAPSTLTSLRIRLRVCSVYLDWWNWADQIRQSKHLSHLIHPQCISQIFCSIITYIDILQSECVKCLCPCMTMIRSDAESTNVHLTWFTINASAKYSVASEPKSLFSILRVRIVYTNRWNSTDQFRKSKHWCHLIQSQYISQILCCISIYLVAPKTDIGICLKRSIHVRMW